MNTKKLKIRKFSRIKCMNFHEVALSNVKNTNENPEIIIYYIDKVEDIFEFANYCKNQNLPNENRTIMVYKKRRKDGVNRNTIIEPFKNEEYPEFKLKAPMLYSLSNTLIN